MRADIAANATGPAMDWRTLTVFISGAVLLCLFYYYGMRGAYYSLGLNAWVKGAFPQMHAVYGDLFAYAYWGAQSLLMRVAVPSLIILYVFRERLSDYGLAWGETGAHLRVYVALYAVMAPLLAIVSFTPGFQATYPFFKPALEGGAKNE